MMMRASNSKSIASIGPSWRPSAICRVGKEFMRFAPLGCGEVMPCWRCARRVTASDGRAMPSDGCACQNRPNKKGGACRAASIERNYVMALQNRRPSFQVVYLLLAFAALLGLLVILAHWGL